MKNHIEEGIAKIEYPRSRKVYMEGEIHPYIKVGMRAVEQLPTVSYNKDGEKVLTPNKEVYIYDTSGPFSDTSVELDLKKA